MRRHKINETFFQWTYLQFDQNGHRMSMKLEQGFKFEFPASYSSGGQNQLKRNRQDNEI